MSTRSLCECGRECRTAQVRLTCDICQAESFRLGCYVPDHGALELQHRWRLDLCRACVESLIARAPEEKRRELLVQAFGPDAFDAEGGVL